MHKFRIWKFAQIHKTVSSITELRTILKSTRLKGFATLPLFGFDSGDFAQKHLKQTQGFGSIIRLIWRYFDRGNRFLLQNVVPGVGTFLKKYSENYKIPRVCPSPAPLE